MLLSNIQSSTSRGGWPDAESGLHVICLAECSLCDRLTVIEFHLVLTSERAKVESRMTKVCRLEERMGAAENDSEALRAARALVEKLKAENASIAPRLTSICRGWPPGYPYSRTGTCSGDT